MLNKSQRNVIIEQIFRTIRIDNSTPWSSIFCFYCHSFETPSHNVGMSKNSRPSF